MLFCNIDLEAEKFSILFLLVFSKTQGGKRIFTISRSLNDFSEFLKSFRNFLTKLKPVKVFKRKFLLCVYYVLTTASDDDMAVGAVPNVFILFVLFMMCYSYPSNINIIAFYNIGRIPFRSRKFVVICFQRALTPSESFYTCYYFKCFILNRSNFFYIYYKFFLNLLV